MDKPTTDIDARDLLCPLPVLRLRKGLERVAPGQSVLLRATDPAARIDVPHFCVEQGHILVDETETPGGALHFTIRKGR